MPDFIAPWIHERGWLPTFQELAQELDFTEKSARDYVRILERKGYLWRQPNDGCQKGGAESLRDPTSGPPLDWAAS